MTAYILPNKKEPRL